MIDRGKLLSDLEETKEKLKHDPYKNLYDKNLITQGINKSIEIVKMQKEIKVHRSWLMNRFLKRE